LRDAVEDGGAAGAVDTGVAAAALPGAFGSAVATVVG
jgi:hypothetical protein